MELDSILVSRQSKVLCSFNMKIKYVVNHSVKESMEFSAKDNDKAEKDAFRFSAREVLKLDYHMGDARATWVQRILTTYMYSIL